MKGSFSLKNSKKVVKTAKSVIADDVSSPNVSTTVTPSTSSLESTGTPNGTTIHTPTSSSSSSSSSTYNSVYTFFKERLFYS